MLNNSVKDLFIQSLNRLMVALQQHDHPNLALQNHLHTQYKLDYPVVSDLTYDPEGNALNINTDVNKNFRLNLNGNILTTSIATSSEIDEINIVINQNPTTAYTMNLNTFLRPNGDPMAISSGLGAIDLLTLKTFNGGITWIADIKKNLLIAD